MAHEQVKEVVEELIDPAYAYAFGRDPAQVPTLGEARVGGLNCEALGHLMVAQVLGVQLPPDLRCYEMYNDNTWLASVPEGQPWQAADLVLLGEADPPRPIDLFQPLFSSDGDLLNWHEYPINHVAVHTGWYDETGHPILVHASPEERKVVTWPLVRFLQTRRYGRIYRVCRPVLSN